MSVTRNSDYTDVYFCETDSEVILEELIEKYESITGRTLYRSDPVMLFLKWLAAVIIQQNLNINEAARQNVPRYADGEFLDSLGELFFNVKRLQGASAVTMLRFTISAPQEDDIVIEGGTRVKSGELMFKTSETAVITAGETNIDVVAEAEKNGTTYNGIEPGGLCVIVDPFPYYAAVTNTLTTSGGVDIEDDDSFYARMRESLEGYSTAGAIGGYKYHAASADARISDISVTSPSPGNVLIKVLLKGGVLPDSNVIDKVLAAVTADDVRPLTDNVSVTAAEKSEYDVDITYYMAEGATQSNDEVDAAVRAAVDKFIAWQCEKMGRDINPSRLISMIMSTAEIKRVDVRSPVYTVVADGAAAIADDVNIVYGGAESE